jgi:hypothetical protein
MFHDDALKPAAGYKIHFHQNSSDERVPVPPHDFGSNANIDGDVRNIDAVVSMIENNHDGDDFDIDDIDVNDDIFRDMEDIINDDKVDSGKSSKPYVDLSVRVPVVDADAYCKRYNISVSDISVSVPPLPMASISIMPPMVMVPGHNHRTIKSKRRRKRKRKPGVKPSERKSMVANKRQRVNGRFVKNDVKVDSK